MGVLFGLFFLVIPIIALIFVICLVVCGGSIGGAYKLKSKVTPIADLNLVKNTELGTTMHKL